MNTFFILISVVVIAIKFFLAKKDADSYNLEPHSSNLAPLSKIKIWHTDGAILDILITLGITISTTCYWEIPILSLLVRASIYDLVFNKYAGLSMTYFGGTSPFDKLSKKVFGVQGAIKQSLFFSILTIAFIVLKVINKI